MGQFEGDDHRETKDVVSVEIIRVLNRGRGEKGQVRENWADFSISASCFTCQVIQSTLKIEYFKFYLGSLWGKGN